MTFSATTPQDLAHPSTFALVMYVRSSCSTRSMGRHAGACVRLPPPPQPCQAPASCPPKLHSYIYPVTYRPRLAVLASATLSCHMRQGPRRGDLCFRYRSRYLAVPSARTRTGRGKEKGGREDFSRFWPSQTTTAGKANAASHPARLGLARGRRARSPVTYGVSDSMAQAQLRLGRLRSKQRHSRLVPGTV